MSSVCLKSKANMHNAYAEMRIDPENKNHPIAMGWFLCSTNVRRAKAFLFDEGDTAQP